MNDNCIPKTNHMMNIDTFRWEVSGEVELTSIVDIKKHFVDWGFNKKTRLLIDLKNVQYINSQGLRKLLEIYKEVEYLGGTTTLIGVKSAVATAIELVGLEQTIPVHHDEIDSSN